MLFLPPAAFENARRINQVRYIYIFINIYYYVVFTEDNATRSGKEDQVRKEWDCPSGRGEHCPSDTLNNTVSQDQSSVKDFCGPTYAHI